MTTFIATNSFRHASEMALLTCCCTVNMRASSVSRSTNNNLHYATPEKHLAPGANSSDFFAWVGRNDDPNADAAHRFIAASHRPSWFANVPAACGEVAMAFLWFSEDGLTFGEQSHITTRSLHRLASSILFALAKKSTIFSYTFLYFYKLKTMYSPFGVGLSTQSIEFLRETTQCLHKSLCVCIIVPPMMHDDDKLCLLTHTLVLRSRTSE